MDGEEMPASQEQPDGLLPVLEVADDHELQDDDHGDAPTNKVDVVKYVNRTACKKFRTYQWESDNGQAHPDDWQSRDVYDAAIKPANEHKEIHRKDDATPLIDEDVCQSASSLIFPVKQFLGQYGQHERQQLSTFYWTNKSVNKFSSRMSLVDRTERGTVRLLK